MRGRGRPLKTEIREKIASILAHTGRAYGYDLYKAYKDIFRDITIRNLYYNLKKGLELGEFIIVEVKNETGNFTWGTESQRVYYALGPYARTFILSENQKNAINKLQAVQADIDWDKEVKTKIYELEKSIQKYQSMESMLKYEEKTRFRSGIKHKIILLKEWMKSKFDKQKAHELHVKLDLLFAQLNH